MMPLLWQKVKNNWRVLMKVKKESKKVGLKFNIYAEYIVQNAGLEEAPAGIKILGRNISNLR